MENVEIEYLIQKMIQGKNSYAYITLNDGMRSFSFSVVYPELDKIIDVFKKISEDLKDRD